MIRPMSVAPPVPVPPGVTVEVPEAAVKEAERFGLDTVALANRRASEELSRPLDTTPTLKPSLRQYFSLTSVGAPAWSPDGGTLAYLSNESGQSQAFVRGADGTVRQLTHGRESVDFVDWTPDGQHLIYGADTNGDEKRQIHMVRPDGTGHVDLTSRPGTIHEYGGLTEDGRLMALASNERNGRDFDLFVRDMHTGERRQVLQGEGMLSPVGFDADGKRLLYVRHFSNLHDQLFVLDVATGESKALTGEEPARWQGARFAADGRSVLVRTDVGREFVTPCRVDLETGAVAPLVERPWDAEAMAVSPDGRTAVLSFNEDGYSRLYRHDLESGETTALANVPEGVVSSLGFREDGTLSFKVSGPTTLSSICTLDPASGALSEVLASPLGPVDPRGLVAPSAVRIPSFDGLEIPGLLYWPPDVPPGKPIPAVVYVHGGPESQTRPQFTSLHQYFLDQGMAVLAPNVRGSTGYGKTFTHKDDIEKRPDSIRDLAATAQWLAAQGVDASKIAVMGGSYGGYMTLAALAFYPKTFAAGVDVVGISNLETFMRNTGPWRVALRAAEYGDPVRDREVLRQWSPIHKVDDIEAPLMVIQGANDPRVPQSEADQMVAALRERGREVRYLLYPDEGHGLAKLTNRVSGYSEVRDFLAEHLGQPS